VPLEIGRSRVTLHSVILTNSLRQLSQLRRSPRASRYPGMDQNLGGRNHRQLGSDSRQLPIAYCVARWGRS